MDETAKTGTPPSPAAESEAKTDPAPNTTAAEAFEIPVLALQNTTLFPDTVAPLAVGRPRSIAAVEAALGTEEKLLGCITVRPDANLTSQDASSGELYAVGTLAMIKRMERIDDTVHIITQGQ